MEILQFDNVTVCYGPDPAVHHVSFRIECGGMAALIGPNGAGKSTLLRAALGWHPLTTGRILIGDEHAHHQLPRLAYLPQRTQVDWNFPVTVRTVVEQGRFLTLGSWRGFARADHAMVDAALDEMEIRGFAHRQVSELSGGQQQRVFLARAVAQGADIFLLDEPFTGLDRRSRDHLLHTLCSWRDQGRTVLAVIHDLDVVRAHFPWVALLDKHLIAAGAAGDVMTVENLEAAYGPALPVMKVAS